MSGARRRQLPSAKRRRASRALESTDAGTRVARARFGIGERTESEIGAGAQVSDCFADEREFGFERGDILRGARARIARRPGAHVVKPRQFPSAGRIREVLRLDETRSPQWNCSLVLLVEIRMGDVSRIAAGQEADNAVSLCSWHAGVTEDNRTAKCGRTGTRQL